jgi:hypothetical protein
VSINTGVINLVNIGDFSLAKGGAFKVGPEHDGACGNFEVAVD